MEPVCSSRRPFRFKFQLFSRCSLCCSVSAHSHGHMPLIMKILAKHSLPTDMDPRILEESTLPSATCIKFKVFTAIFSLHFTKIVFRLFAILGSFVPFASLQQFSRNRRQAWSHSSTHTHKHAHLLTPIVPYVLCVFLSCVEFGLAASWTLHLLLQLLWLPHLLLLWCLLSTSQFYTVFLFSYPAKRVKSIRLRYLQKTRK